MRRKQKDIRDLSRIEPILRRARVCRLAMTDGEMPYVVPLCFGHHENTLYFHTGREGMKLDVLGKNPRVCFEVDVAHEMVPGVKPCNWSMNFNSVIGFGTATVVANAREKRRALDIIMSHYAGGETYTYPDDILALTVVIRVDIDSMTAKTYGEWEGEGAA